MTQKFKFSEGERVLCFHGPLIYEAKALKSTISKDKQIKYYIHYAGWNKNWDEWVPEDRVLKYNEANVQRQQEVFKEHSSAATNKNKKAATKGKKGDGTITKDGGTSSGGSESRASTPSKEVGNLSATSRSRSKQSAASGTTNKEASASGGSKEVETKKDDAKDANAGSAVKEEKEEPQKRKRGGSASSAHEKSSNDKTNATANGTTTGAASVTASSSAASTPTPSERRSAEPCSTNSSTLESSSNFLAKQEVKIKIPDELKQCLADDWDAVTRQHKLIEVPAKITVEDITEQYIAFKKSTKSTNSSKEIKISDVVNGIIEYFNVMLGSQLLYKYERPRYAEILQQYPDLPPSQLYGAFHLLRLFVKLGSMLGYSDLDANKMTTLVSYLQDFLKFLVKNSSTYFTMANFVNASLEYHRNTQ